MNFTAVRDAVKQADLFRYKGKIEKIIGMTIEASGPTANIGDVCRIYRKNENGKADASYIYGEVVGFNNGKVMLMPYTDIEGIGPGSIVDNTGRQLQVGVSDELVGRMAKEIREIDEALIAGDKVKEAIEVVVADLEEAEYCAEMDLRSGKGAHNRAKYRHLNEAEGHIATLQIQMGSFRTELADVDIDTDINVDVGGICTEFADMFGNIFTEIKVLDKIRRLHNQAKNTRADIISAMFKLEQKRDSLYNEMKDTRKQVENLVIDTAI